ncbi:hypothetical protein, partial [Pseudoalteromonas sp.]|uniref:hypothetical protein n=1 Tax=Pseudoalteromonas sp. TaxID=53249 RepID=UPI00260F4610
MQLAADEIIIFIVHLVMIKQLLKFVKVNVSFVLGRGNNRSRENFLDVFQKTDVVKSFHALGRMERETYLDGCAPHMSC